MDNEQSLDLVESANQAEPTEQPLAQEPNSTPEPEGNLEPTEVGDTHCHKPERPRMPKLEASHQQNPPLVGVARPHRHQCLFPSGQEIPCKQRSRTASGRQNSGRGLSWL